MSAFPPLGDQNSKVSLKFVHFSAVNFTEVIVLLPFTSQDLAFFFFLLGVEVHHHCKMVPPSFVTNTSMMYA